MISIIVPVYKVEAYLHQCVDSILNQTYRDIEVLLIDDGSPDRCGEICDEYAEKDDRVRVFHTENRGLSAARNLGISEAKGDYIGFVDSDDWIESDMYEVLLRRMQETGADISEARRVRGKHAKEIYNTNEALKALVMDNISNSVWSKLYCSTIFEGLCFPEGKSYEDIAIMHKLLIRARLVTVVYRLLYHHRRRIDSISMDYSAKNLIDYADAYLERYRFFQEECPDYFQYYKEGLIRGCIKGNAGVWRWWYGCSAMEKQSYKGKIEELRQFARIHFLPVENDHFSFNYRFATFFLKSNSNVSFKIMYEINRIYMKVKLIVEELIGKCKGS